MKTEKKSDTPEVIELKNDAIINGVFRPKGTVLELTEELKELLKPFGYFVAEENTKQAKKSDFISQNE